MPDTHKHYGTYLLRCLESGSTPIESVKSAVLKCANAVHHHFDVAPNASTYYIGLPYYTVTVIQ